MNRIMRARRVRVRGGRGRRGLVALATGLVLAAVPALAGPLPAAQAAARVSIANDQGSAAIDPTYSTRLKVTGRGFQSIRSGHGGIYVFFGTVSGQWRPSKGGSTGENYFYVPDNESKDNAGHQSYVAFPGSDTAASANGGVVSADGRWSATVTVPGATFKAVDRKGRVRTVDCRKVTCGIITVGAHGVANSANETFTPVAVKDLYGGKQPSGGGSTAPSATATQDSGTATAQPDAGDATGDGASPDATGEVPAAGKPVLSVDRTSAVAGRVLSFTARGLPAGAQVSAVLDDGVAAAGPFLVSAQGQVTGVLTLPLDLGSGTHELRLFGLAGEDAPLVRFAVAPADDTTPVAAQTEAAEETDVDRLGIWFFLAAGLILLAAVLRLVLLARRPKAADAA
ncbi:hypothetical protein KG112_02300 [Nocardioides sp. zg-ZUI104]|uniref:hypothetical protein n=1 Tax=Nocardioides faecalis TaxID=2803858 RepID=UPI001BCCBE46|nr:hypothetical protein [Nocardioides faecalis]MBS4751637.1 hypothetical protein [Nocardioides faecalis]